MANLVSIKRESVVESVFDQFMDKIACGEWGEGELIPSENELRAALGVSRDTVRQAIKRMCALGLLESRQGRGTVVKKADIGLAMNGLIPYIFLAEDDGSKIFSFMKAVQVECARIAAAAAGPEEIAQLEDCIENMRSARVAKDFFEADNQYHFTLARFTGNELFTRSMELASGFLKHNLTRLVSLHGGKTSIEQHRACLDRIIAHDPEGAARVMVEHYDLLAQRLGETLAQEDK